MIKTKALFITDLHFKVNNNEEIDIFIPKILDILQDLVSKYGETLFVVLGGDLLDTHERIHQTPYNRMIKFINSLCQMSYVVILVGNHDFENNQQFLTDKHWLNPLKQWGNVSIVDKVLYKFDCIFCPYVPPGRFQEALNTSQVNWRDVKCIFAHQEFKGCDFGNSVSQNGDKWSLNAPLIISGHIHKKQRPQKNIIYPGSIFQHNHGEENNINEIILIDLNNVNDDENAIINIPINICKYETILIDAANFTNTIKNLKFKPLQKIRIVCNGNEENFKFIKKSKIYINLPPNVKIKFSNVQNETFNTFTPFENSISKFDDILKNKISDSAILNKILYLTSQSSSNYSFETAFELLDSSL